MLIETIKNSIILLSLCIIAFVCINIVIIYGSLKQCKSELTNMQNSVKVFENDAKNLRDKQETKAIELEKNKKKVKVENKTSQEAKKSIVEIFKANEKDSL